MKFTRCASAAAALSVVLSLHTVRAEGVTPLGQPATGWKLVFDDEFDGSNLDVAKWRPNWLGPDDKAVTKPINVEEVSCYDPAQISVAGGELKLQAVERDCKQWSYASGMVETDGKFNFQFGYAEAKIWMPSGPGLWPAFWINGHRNPEDGEIDVVEASGTDAGRYHYHYQCGPKRCSPGGEIPVKGATSGWHVYAAEWKPDVIAWYYDGRKVFERHEAIGSAPHYLVLNLGLRRNGNGYAVPGTMRVDYVRVWQH